MTRDPQATNSQAPGPKQLRLPRTVRNVMSNWGGFSFSVLVNFLLSPFIVHQLGNSGYGIWTLMLSLTGYLGLLDLGIRGAVTRYVAKFYTEGNHAEANRTASSALAVFSGAGFLAISASLVLAFFVNDFFTLPAGLQDAARIVLVLTGTSVAVALVSGVFGGILVGLQRFDLVNGIEVSMTALRALAVILVLNAGMGIVALAGIQLALSLARGSTKAFASFRLYPQLRVRFVDCDRPHLKMVFSFSIYSFLLSVFYSLIYYTDAVVIGVFLPVGMITFFVIAGNLLSYGRNVIAGISRTMTPLASSLEAQRDQAELQRVMLTGAGYATMVTLPIAVTFLLRGAPFISLWMGPEYADLSGQVLRILTLAWMIDAGNRVARAIMLGISRHKPLVLVYLVEAVLNVAISVSLVRSMGIVGVAWGTTGPDLAAGLFFFPWYVRRTLGIPIRRYLFSTWVRPGVAILPFALGTYGMEILWPAPNLVLFFLQVGAVLPLALLGFWFICFTPAERSLFVEAIVHPALRWVRRG